MREDKPASKDLRLYKALEKTRGWNPVLRAGSAVRFRCMNCGCLIAVAAKDTQGEWEGKCPVCKHVHVVNRHPERWGTPYNLESLERMLR